MDDEEGRNLQAHFNALMEALTQHEPSGGANTAASVRLILIALALEIGAKEIVELGYDAGVTVRALALTGAHVVGIDNVSEYRDTKGAAEDHVASFHNAELREIDADTYLKSSKPIDLIFVDDNHEPEHVRQEAESIRRVLRPGGIAVFHDTLGRGLGEVVRKVLPDWMFLELPGTSSYKPSAGESFGIGIFRKPG